MAETTHKKATPGTNQGGKGGNFVNIDPTEAFRKCLSANGIDTTEPIIGDGELHRFHVVGDKASSKNGQICVPIAASDIVANAETISRSNDVPETRFTSLRSILSARPV